MIGTTTQIPYRLHPRKQITGRQRPFPADAYRGLRSTSGNAMAQPRLNPALATTVQAQHSAWQLVVTGEGSPRPFRITRVRCCEGFRMPAAQGHQCPLMGENRTTCARLELYRF